MNIEVGRKIGASLGRVEDVDVVGDGTSWGRCLRIRVHPDLHRPLEQGRALTLNGQSHWVSFRYEKLPLFCFPCGRINHDVVGCPGKSGSRLYANCEKQRGVLLRAEEPKRGFTSRRARFDFEEEDASGASATAEGESLGG